MKNFFLIALCLNPPNLSSPTDLMHPKEIGGVLSKWNVISTAVSNLTSIDRKNYQSHEINLKLPGNVELGALFFPYQNSKTLLIASFGFLADRWSNPSAQFILNFIEKGYIKSNVLIIDHPTSAGFYAKNASISPGGYDEGRMILQTALQVQHDYSSIHLLGVSMGGNGVLQALAEDQRLEKRIFSTSIVFSTAHELTEIPGRALFSFYPKGKENPWDRNYIDGVSNDPASTLGIKRLFSHFLDSYLYLKNQSLTVLNNEWGPFLYREFNHRLETIREKVSSEIESNWNPDMNTQSLEGYESSSNTVNLISNLKTPVIVIHAEDDSAVPIRQHRDFVRTSSENNCVVPLELKNGGHWGFMGIYGMAWVSNIINKVFNP